jgi:hypothetical protein
VPFVEFKDEETFTHGIRTPISIEELENKQSHVIGTVLSAKHVFGPFVFDGQVKNKLSGNVTVIVCATDGASEISGPVVQQDVAPAHFEY